MAAPKGNQYARKLTDRDSRQAAYVSYCNWISKGNPCQSWTYEDGDQRLSYKTIQRQMKDFPDDCPISHLDYAHAKSLNEWIEIGRAMMTSEQRCQPAIFQMMMRNIHGWDKESPEEKHDREKKEEDKLTDLAKAIRGLATSNDTIT